MSAQLTLLATVHPTNMQQCVSKPAIYGCVRCYFRRSYKVSQPCMVGKCARSRPYLQLQQVLTAQVLQASRRAFYLQAFSSLTSTPPPANGAYSPHRRRNFVHFSAATQHKEAPTKPVGRYCPPSASCHLPCATCRLQHNETCQLFVTVRVLFPQ